MNHEVKFPDAWCERMRKQLGADASAFFQAHEQAAPISIRTNPQKSAHLEAAISTPVPWSDFGHYLKERPVFTLDPLLHAGAYYVQEAGSMLIEALLKTLPKPLHDPVVLDMCAAPGGKSISLLDTIVNQGVLVSNELVPSRNSVLRHNLSRWGRANSIITSGEAHHFPRDPLFDLILVDAPCSGEGLFRKDMRARTEWSEEQAQNCTIRQKQILLSIFPTLRPGGYLLYSTCTYNPDENDNRVEELIHQTDLQPLISTPPEGVCSTKYGWQAFPHKVSGEGFYCCILYKPGKADSLNCKTGNNQKTPSVWIDYVEQHNTQLIFTKEKYGTVAFPVQMQPIIEVLKNNHVPIRQYGILLGELKGDSALPSAELALSGLLSSECPQFGLEKDEALAYLAGETRFSGAYNRGIYLITYQGLGLGWAKWVGNRWNNHYPNSWRIRMDIKKR